MTKVNRLLVGAGDIAAKRVASALKNAADSQLIAICDLNKDRARDIAQKFGIPKVYTDYLEALNCDDIDAVYLATPIHLHGSQAIQSIAEVHGGHPHRHGAHCPGYRLEYLLGSDANACQPVSQVRALPSSSMP